MCSRKKCHNRCQEDVDVAICYALSSLQNRSLCNITTRVPMPLVKHVNREDFSIL